MYAITIWQPWASLIAEGAKPYEFRAWRYDKRLPRLYGQRVAIHAAARPIRSAEVNRLLETLRGKPTIVERVTGLVPHLAIAVLEQAFGHAASLFDEGAAPGLPMSAVLCTAILGEPTKNPIVGGQPLRQDSDRLDQMNWAWPLIDVKRLPFPIPARGAQGFWKWNEQETAA